MKYLAVVLCVLVATAFAANEEQVKESARRVKQAHDKCNEDPATHIDSKAAKKAHDEGKHHEDPNLDAHVLCVSKTLGWQKADGSIDVDLIRSRATAIFGENDNLEAIITECTQDKGSAIENAKHIFQCYRKNAPQPAHH